MGSSRADAKKGATPPSKQEVVDELNERGWVSLWKAIVLLEVTYPTALKYVKAGKLETIRVGGIIRVHKQAIVDFLKGENSAEQSY